MKKTIRCSLFSALFFVMILGMTFTVHAARTIPKKVRCYPSEVEFNSLVLTLDRCEYIRITSAKGIDARLYKESWNTQLNTSEACILYRISKAGEYTLKFNIYDALTKKKKTSTSIQIFAKKDTPFKAILVDGKETKWSPFGNNKFIIPNSNKTTFSFKIQMNSGYKLKQLKYSVNTKPQKTATVNGNIKNTQTSNTRGEEISFKNGASLPKPKYVSTYISEIEISGSSGQVDSSYYSTLSFDKSMHIRISYIDKYSGEEMWTGFNVIPS